LLARLFGRGDRAGSISEDTVVDLSLSGFLGPVAVTTLCALRTKAADEGRTLSIRPPKHAPLYAYCRYSGLLQQFEAGPSPTSHPESVTTAVAQFRTLPVEEVDKIVQLADMEMTLPRAGREHLKLALYELLQNVLDHSE